jgi:hypothetical protein
MSDAPTTSLVLTRGLLAGVVMFAVGAMFHWLIPVFVPLIDALYKMPPFRPLPGWPLYYFIAHPFWFGFALAWLFTLLEPRTRTAVAGARFGAVLFLVGALPVYLLTHASIAMPWPVVLCWLLQGFSQYVLAGAALGLHRARPSCTTPVRRSGWASTETPQELLDAGDQLRQLQAPGKGADALGVPRQLQVPGKGLGPRKGG